MMIAGGVIGGKKPSILFTDAQHNLPVNQTTYTATDISFGPASSKRRVIVGVAVSTATGVQPDQMTIGGVAATLHDGIAPSGTFSVTVQIWSALVPTGETGTITMSVPSGDMGGGSLYVFAAHDLRDSAPTDTAADRVIGDPDGTDVSIDVKAGGVVVAVAATSNTNPATFSFTGLTVPDQDSSPNFQSAGAYLGEAQSASPMHIKAVFTIGAGPSSPSAVAVSWR